MKHDTAAIRSSLQERLRTLQSRLTEIHDTLHEPEHLDLDDQVFEWDEDLVLQNLDAIRHELLLVRTALRRIDDGSYGRCLSCRRAVSMKRLRALPETTQCLRCAQKLDRMAVPA